MIRSIITSVAVHTTGIARETVLIRPGLPILIGTGHAFLPDLLSPHDVLTAQLGTVVFDPFGDGLAGIGLGLQDLSTTFPHSNIPMAAYNRGVTEKKRSEEGR